MTPLLGRVENVAQRVTHQVESQRQRQNGRTWNEDEPRRRAEIGLVLEDDVAPGGDGRLNADAEEGEGGFQKHCGGDAERRPDDDGGKQVRQDVAKQDAAGASAHCTLRHHEVALGDGASFGVGHAGDLHPVHHGDYHRHDPKARAENRRQNDGQQQGRKSHHQVGETHQQGVDPATEIACRNPHCRTDQHRDAVGHDTDHQRGLGAIDQAAEKIAPYKIGAEPELRARGQRRAFDSQPFEELFIWIVRLYLSFGVETVQRRCGQERVRRYGLAAVMNDVKIAIRACPPYMGTQVDMVSAAINAHRPKGRWRFMRAHGFKDVLRVVAARPSDRVGDHDYCRQRGFVLAEIAAYDRAVFRKEGGVVQTQRPVGRKKCIGGRAYEVVEDEVRSLFTDLTDQVIDILIADRHVAFAHDATAGTGENVPRDAVRLPAPDVVGAGQKGARAKTWNDVVQQRHQMLVGTGCHVDQVLRNLETLVNARVPQKRIELLDDRDHLLAAP
ncbi:hypothetical protein KSW81_003256 [Nannochloris sp. 'desiccata']|nr:hypothetical protein KSW81_003256 [Chlorella desiccata (nom. nud.)]